MTTLEQDLDRLRERLRVATAADLRRRARRRRRIAQLALVPALALTAGGVAIAVEPVLNEPAPPRVQQTFDELHTRDPAHAPLVPQGQELELWARDGALALYGATSPSGEWCTLANHGVPQGASCRSDWTRPSPDEIKFTALGGAGLREANFASGQVGAPAAETVEISVPGVPIAAKVRVGHDGWFIAQLPDSTLGSPHGPGRPPELEAVARDAAGTVVARSLAP
jgi:hypothetical protein